MAVSWRRLLGTGSAAVSVLDHGFQLCGALWVLVWVVLGRERLPCRAVVPLLLRMCLCSAKSTLCVSSGSSWVPPMLDIP